MNPAPNSHLDGLTEIQSQAAAWGEGALMLLAGPGSGKTRVLTSRIARLFSEEPDARWRILALTFTTRAADEMRHRVEQLIPDSVERMFAGTFHSFACEVLRQSGSPVGVKTDFKIYSTAEDRALLLREALGRAGIDLGEGLDRAFPVLDGLRERLASPETCLRFFSEEDRAQRFAAAYAAYNRHLQEVNALDFPAIIYMAHRLFTEFPAIAARYRRTYRYTSLDEFQDTNQAQYAFVRAFTGDEYPNIFVVADDDQVIYQWNGANPKRLQQFAMDYQPAVLQMPTNFRCPREVVAMANGLVAYNLLRTQGKNPLEAGKNLPLIADRVRLLTFDTDADEAAGIAADLVERRGASPGEVAVIARTKNLLLKVQEELAALGMPAQLAQRRDNFASVPYQWLHQSLQVANRRSDVRAFADFVESGNALFEADLDAEELAAIALSTHGDLLRTWLDHHTPSGGLAAAVAELIATDLVGKNDFRRYARAIAALFTDTSWGLADTQPSFEEDARAWRELFVEIQGLVGRTAPLDTFLQELALRSKEPPIKPGSVPLLTIHGSKGNEFDHVYLIGMAEDMLPSYQSRKHGDSSPQMEEERRNCFVAITRCRETLTLSRAGKYNNWGKAPSRFLAEMDVEGRLSAGRGS